MGLPSTEASARGFAVQPVAPRSATPYAVRIHDTTMSPAFEPGYLLHVDPTRVVKAGDRIVVHLRDERSFVRRFVYRTEDAFVCEQFNPPVRIEYKPVEIKAIHAVVGYALGADRNDSR